MCLPSTEVTPPNEKSRKMVRNLKILLVGQIMATILTLVANHHHMMLYKILACVILYLSYTQLDFCSAILYIFFCASQLFNLLLTFGTFWQNRVTIKQFGTFRFTANIILAVFNIVAIWVVFLAYREFKAISMGSYQPSYTRSAGENANQSSTGYGAVGKNIYCINICLIQIIFRYF